MELQLHVSRQSQELKPEVNSVKNDYFRAFAKKPVWDTGFWTSTWRPETYDSEWVDWCLNRELVENVASNWFLLKPRSDIRVFEVDCMSDLMRLVMLYSVPFADPVPVGIHYPVINFEQLAQDYDALHLTSHGNEQLHTSLPHDMNGWEVESTVWFRWCFEKVEQPKLPYPHSLLLEAH